MKSIVFLGDGMADEPIAGLGGKTPIEAAQTPHMDQIAREGRCGTLLTLPDGFPTSSDVANLSVLGYDLATSYAGRGPIEAASQGIELVGDEIAFRCNLITEKDGILDEYSGGHLTTEEAVELITALNEAFGSDRVRFHPGVSYRNLLILKGKEFSPKVAYQKPDSSQGMNIKDLLLEPEVPEAEETARLLNDLTLRSPHVLEPHPVNGRRRAEGKKMANMIWPWSPGGRPTLTPFQEKYGITGAIISAVDVVFGIGVLAGMEIIRVPGATGFIDTNYEGKADAALDALTRHDFVYVHVEATDEVSHLGELDKKIQALQDLDSRLIGRFMENAPDDVAMGVLPDHPVPIALRKHTRTPVPFAIRRPGLEPDEVQRYGEAACRGGIYGQLEGDGFMRALLGHV
jgi:2,3-bisphosphoglycerate-independent phosphoglycerate mutase